MTRTLRAIAASALLVLLAGCAGSAPPEPRRPAADGDPVTAEVVDFDPDGDVGDPPPALSVEPIALRVFAGWDGWAAPGHGPPLVAGSGRVFLAVAGYTHCRLPTGVEVRRSGDDLRVVFTGGVDHEECARPYRPAAVLGLAAADVAGVRTVDGRVPVSAGGPGVLTAFVVLDRVASTVPVAVEIGRDDGELVAALGGDPRARAALGRPVPAGSRAFAFVLPGCGDTGAVLLLGADGITAEPTGGGDRLCDAPEHYLAAFDVPAALVPPDAVLGRS